MNTSLPCLPAFNKHRVTLVHALAASMAHHFPLEYQA
jgi:hypothetical protein